MNCCCVSRKDTPTSSPPGRHLSISRPARQQELEAVRRGDPGAAAVAGASANPVYQSIQLQLHETDVQIAALRGELNDYRGNVAELRHALDTAPEVEAEFTRLTRDYEVTQTQYNGLLQRLEQARVSEDAQQTGIVEFQIVDPPTAPFNPVFPTRPVLLVAVLMLAVGLGAGIAWLLSKLRPVFLHGAYAGGDHRLAGHRRHRPCLARSAPRHAQAGLPALCRRRGPAAGDYGARRRSPRAGFASRAAVDELKATPMSIIELALKKFHDTGRVEEEQPRVEPKVGVIHEVAGQSEGRSTASRRRCRAESSISIVPR